MEIKLVKLEKPKQYDYILDCCVHYQDGDIDKLELISRLARLELTVEQFTHIMGQARHLTGNNVNW
jgi:hypothetical protein